MMTDVISSSSISSWKMYFSIVTLYLTALMLDCACSVTSTFRPSSPGITLRRLAVDSRTGTVYVGAVDHIYQLDSSLSLLVDASTNSSSAHNYNQVTLTLYLGL